MSSIEPASNNDTAADVEAKRGIPYNDGASIHQQEALSPMTSLPVWKSLKEADGDTALALFDNTDQLHEIVDPVAEARVRRKVDLVILPLLAVCYSFYYVRL